MRIVIPGQPIAQGRHRMGNGIAYTPKRTRTWQGVARTAAFEVMGDAELFTGPLMLIVTARFAVPSSWPQWKRTSAFQGVIVPAGKPDIDNVVKNVKDALSQVVWQDDCQVVYLRAAKEYGHQPCVIAEIVSNEGKVSPSGLRKKDLP